MANVAPNQKNKENGNKAPTATTAPAETAKTEPATTEMLAVEGEAGEQKRRKGAIPTMPMCVVYTRQDGRCVAAVVSPKGGRYEAVGRGQGSAMGELVDLGFVLSSLHNNPPEWMTDKGIVPDSVKEILGYATISGFPLPKQD